MKRCELFAWALVVAYVVATALSVLGIFVWHP